MRASPLIVCLFSVKVELEATSNLLEVQFFVASTVTATYLMALSIFELVVIVHVDALLLFPHLIYVQPLFQLLLLKLAIDHANVPVFAVHVDV